MTAQLPVYSFDISRVFPELPSTPQSTGDPIRPAAALSLAVAYLLRGLKFRGVLADLTPDEIFKELELACMGLQIPVERLFNWANSLLVEPEETLSNDDFNKSIPVRLDGPGFRAHAYQREEAAWAAHRYGSLLALGCGVGKSATATLAAMGAGVLGKANTERCIIISPLNAMPQWEDYIPDLRKVYKNVAVISCDSLHHYTSLDTGEGGALIIDEVHKLKNQEADRTGYAHVVRLRMDWAVGLTGTLLHTGCEGLLSMFDLACPGLARFLDKFDFGEWLEAVVNKRIRSLGGYRRSLVLPPEHTRDRLQAYLARGARSLDFESEEVASLFQVPGQTKTLEDLWGVPQWVEELRAAHRTERAKKLAAEGLPPPLPGSEAYEDTPYLWIPDLEWTIGMAVVTRAMQEEREMACLRWVSTEDREEYTYPEDVEKARQRLDRELEYLDTPEGRKSQLEMADIEDDNEGEEDKEPPRVRLLKSKRKLLGIPHFSASYSAMRMEGSIDRVIERVVEQPEGGPKRVVYRWRYAPGSSADNPAPGPKIQRVMRWLRENPEEPAVIGASSVLSLNLMGRCLEEEGVTYRLIRGGVSLKDRKAFVADFQKGRIRVMLVQQVAGSESVTLTRAAMSLLIDHSLSPDVYSQFLGRTRRQGQKRECEHFDYAFNSTQVERILALRRGESFDAETRHALESAVQYALADLSLEENPHRGTID